ncbi:Xenotropic and polytropic retrovirus receptor 1 [Balamuthia mandrillaris]
MKFGKKLTRKLVPEWQGSYVHYKALKQQIKKIKKAREAYYEARSKLTEVTGIAQTVEIDVSLLKEDLRFFELLERELEVCEEFYHEQLDAAYEKFYELIQQLIQLDVIDDYTPPGYDKNARLDNNIPATSPREVDRKEKKEQSKHSRKALKQKEEDDEADEGDEEAGGLDDVSLHSGGSSSDDEALDENEYAGHSEPRLSLDETYDAQRESSVGLLDSVRDTTECLITRKNKTIRALQYQRAERKRKYPKRRSMPRVVSSHRIFGGNSPSPRSSDEELGGDYDVPAYRDHELGLSPARHKLVIDMSGIQRQALRGDEKVVFSLDLGNKRAKKQALKTLKTAFQEHYRGLCLLEQYCMLNTEGFDKALKKHDKHLGTRVRYKYFVQIRKDHQFVQMKQLYLLKTETEKLFCSAFSPNCRKKGMQKLRIPEKRPGLGWSTFRFGLFGGASLALMVVLACLCFALELDDSESPHRPERLDSMLVVYRMIFVLLLMVWVWGVDAYIWTKNRISYAFIFRFDSRSHIRWQNLLEAAAGFTIMWTFSFTMYLLSEVDVPPFGWLQDVPFQLFPFSLLVLAGLMIIAQQVKARWWLVRSLTRTVSSPFSRPLFPDIYIAEQLCSLVLFFNDLQYSLCFFLSDAWTGDDVCSDISPYVRPCITALPYFWRLMQCLRNYNDDRRRWSHLMHALTYVSAITIILAATLFSFLTSPPSSSSSASPEFIWWIVFWVALMVVGVVYTSFWDIKKDWNLGDATASHKFLRDHIIYSPWYYYSAMISNCLMRGLWALTISSGALIQLLPSSASGVMITVLACVEVLRRGQWNLFKLENEQLNNIGKSQAIRDVKLKLPVSEYGHELRAFSKLDSV